MSGQPNIKGPTNNGWASINGEPLIWAPPILMVVIYNWRATNNGPHINKGPPNVKRWAHIYGLGPLLLAHPILLGLLLWAGPFKLAWLIIGGAPNYNISSL